MPYCILMSGLPVLFSSPLLSRTEGFKAPQFISVLQIKTLRPPSSKKQPDSVKGWPRVCPAQTPPQFHLTWDQLSGSEQETREVR